MRKGKTGTAKRGQEMTPEEIGKKIRETALADSQA